MDNLSILPCFKSSYSLQFPFIRCTSLLFFLASLFILIGHNFLVGLWCLNFKPLWVPSPYFLDSSSLLWHSVHSSQDFRVNELSNVLNQHRNCANLFPRSTLNHISLVCDQSELRSLSKWLLDVDLTGCKVLAVNQTQLHFKVSRVKHFEIVGQVLVQLTLNFIVFADSRRVQEPFLVRKNCHCCFLCR